MMVNIQLKGNSFNVSFAGRSSSRHVSLFRNQIMNALKQVGVPSGHIKIEEDVFPLLKRGAEVYWYVNERNCYYSYNRQEKYVDNLQVIARLLEQEVAKLILEEKTMDEFIHDFKEEDDLEEKRKEARILLNVPESEKDLEIIDRQFKSMAKEAHPDMPNGDTERFKQLNEAHKLLKKELE